MGIIELLLALPKILGAAQSLLEFFEKTLGPNWEEEAKKLNESHEKLKNAKTDAEIKDAIMEYARFRNRK